MNVLKESLKFIIDIVRLPDFHFYKFPLKNKFNGKAYILANGPSLKKDLSEYDNSNCFFDSNTFVVNMFALDSHFKKIKPMHYCLSDPMFYQDYKPKTEQIRKMYDILENEVDWEMYLYICFFTEKEYRKIISYSKITNPHIHFVKLNRKHCENLNSNWRNKLYSTGYFMPQDGTIANTAIYVALLEGYKNVEIYGCDHDMFRDFTVDENNRLCTYDSHFYDKEKPALKPFMNCLTTDEKPFRVHEFFYIMSVMFKSHDLLQSFSEYLGAKILNCTPHSMIDSYPRKKGC